MPFHAIPARSFGNMQGTNVDILPSAAQVKFEHTRQYEPNLDACEFTWRQIYLAQMRIANAALRLTPRGGLLGHAMRKEQVLENLRACGLDVNTRHLFRSTT